MKKYFYLKLVPCRPTFSQDMTPEERAIMLKHVTYWTDWMNRGFVLAFGPVMDPKGVFGVGIVAVNTEEEVNAFIANDPAATINTYEVYPMRAIVPNK
ncbi:MAG TPA: YciI family protein [Puia sp.]|nr:YciI family protein [Puia sp.]